MKSRGCAGVDSLLFGGKDTEQAENSYHFEGLGRERRRIHEFCVASELPSAAECIDDSADARRIDEGHLLEIKDEVDAAIGQRGLQGGVKIRNARGLELAFDTKGTRISGLLDVEIHEVSCKLKRMIHKGESACYTPSTEIDAYGSFRQAPGPRCHVDVCLRHSHVDSQSSCT